MKRRRARLGEERKLCMIQSKITLSTQRRIDAIVEKYGFNARYELIQYVLSAFLSYADPEGEESGQDNDILRQIGTIFSGFEYPENRFNIVGSRPDFATLSTAIYIYQQNEGRAYCKTMKYADDVTVSSCSTPQAFQILMQKLLPEQYECLMRIANELGSDSALVALNHLIEADKRCGTLSTADYASNEYGNVPVRKHHKDINSL